MIDLTSDKNQLTIAQAKTSLAKIGYKLTTRKGHQIYGKVLHIESGEKVYRSMPKWMTGKHSAFFIWLCCNAIYDDPYSIDRYQVVL